MLVWDKDGRVHMCFWKHRAERLRQLSYALWYWDAHISWDHVVSGNVSIMTSSKSVLGLLKDWETYWFCDCSSYITFFSTWWENFPLVTLTWYLVIIPTLVKQLPKLLETGFVETGVVAMSLTPALGYLWVQAHPSVHSEFQDSQDCMKSLKNKNRNMVLVLTG